MCQLWVELSERDAQVLPTLPKMMVILIGFLWYDVFWSLWTQEDAFNLRKVKCVWNLYLKIISIKDSIMSNNYFEEMFIEETF